VGLLGLFIALGIGVVAQASAQVSAQPVPQPAPQPAPQTAPKTAAQPASKAVTLKVFAGGSGQRPDLTRQLLAQYSQRHPHIKVEVETGGATSDLQRQYLSTILNAKDATIDVYLIDIVNPAQYHGAGWLEPLDKLLGPPAQVLQPYLPAYASANVVDGELAALPAFADAMFLYYRRDLLEKHRQPLPRTWDELAGVARAVQAAEKASGSNGSNGISTLQGLSIQGAPIEGTVCTFLLPYWSLGKELSDSRGKQTLDRAAAAQGLQQWLTMVDQGVIKKNVAEVRTSDTLNEFKAGQVLFAINWGFAWDRYQSDADSKVKGQVGVLPLPAVAGGRSASCLGGWQWAVSAFSRHKTEAAKLVSYLASAEASRFYAVRGSLLPAHRALYSDAEVLQAVPWFRDAGPAVMAARSRPVSPDYPQVSDAIRTSTSAALARTKTPERATAEIGSRLARIMR
jgi:multiple sugar transport system substrate-binding protein